MNGPMTPWRPVSVTLYVRDRDAAIRFYESAFGMRWNDEIGAFQFGEFPGDDFYLVSLRDATDDPDRRIGAGHFGYVVADVDQSHQHGIETGAREWYAPEENPGAPRSSGLEDPDGNRIELWQA